MSKKTTGPKEAALRELREGKAENGLFDVDGYQKELEALREKHLTGIRGKILELGAQRRQIDEELNKLNAVENSITGHASRAPVGGTGKKKRVTSEEKLTLAEVIFEKMHGSKLNKFSSTDLKDFSNGIQPRELISIWNQHHKADKSKSIHTEGAKAATRYWVS
jgi:hypothetical protein